MNKKLIINMQYLGGIIFLVATLFHEPISLVIGALIFYVAAFMNPSWLTVSVSVIITLVLFFAASLLRLYQISMLGSEHAGLVMAVAYLTALLSVVMAWRVLLSKPNKK